MKNIDTIIFDLDGTLLYTLEDLADSVNYVLEEHGYLLRTLAEVNSFVGNGLERLLELSLGERPEDFGQIFAEFKKHYAANCNNKTRLYDGVKETLAALKNGGYKMAIVTNKNTGALEVLKKIYFDGLIDVAVGQSEGLRRKPAPDGVLLALKILGSDKNSAVYVGDSEVDAMTAANSGLPLIACLWGFRDRKILEEHGAEIFAEKPRDIIEILKK